MENKYRERLIKKIHEMSYEERRNILLHDLDFLLFDLEDDADCEDERNLNIISHAIISFLLYKEVRSSSKADEHYLSTEKNHFYDAINRLKAAHHDLKASFIEVYAEEFLFKRYMTVRQHVAQALNQNSSIHLFEVDGGFV